MTETQRRTVQSQIKAALKKIWTWLKGRPARVLPQTQSQGPVLRAPSNGWHSVEINLPDPEWLEQASPPRVSSPNVAIAGTTSPFARNALVPGTPLCAAVRVE